VADLAFCGCFRTWGDSFNVPFGTIEVQDVTNKSQCLKEAGVNQKDISHKNNVR
jgi:hypothetical protein